MLKIYCDSCGSTQLVIFQDIKKDDLNKDPWGDILCVNRHVIATLSAEVEGEIAFIKKDSNGS